METTVNTTDRHWQELAQILRTEWEGGPVDRQRILHLAGELLPQSPDMRHTLAHLTRRMSH